MSFKIVRITLLGSGTTYGVGSKFEYEGMTWPENVDSFEMSADNTQVKMFTHYTIQRRRTEYVHRFPASGVLVSYRAKNVKYL